MYLYGSLNTDIYHLLLICFLCIIFLGKGPKTFFHVGTDHSIDSLKQDLNNGHQIMFPDHCISNGGGFKCGTVSGYSRIPKMGLSGIPKMDIIVTLPGNLTFPDINWLSLYCRRFRLNFGEMVFTEPPTTPAPGNHFIK